MSHPVIKEDVTPDNVTPYVTPLKTQFPMTRVPEIFYLSPGCAVKGQAIIEAMKRCNIANEYRFVHTDAERVILRSIVS